MGGGASHELTAEDKAVISGKVQQQYEELKNKKEGEENDDMKLFETLRGAYEESHKEVIHKKSFSKLPDDSIEQKATATEESASEPAKSDESGIHIDAGGEIGDELGESLGSALTGRKSKGSRHGKHIGYSFDNEDLPEYHEFGVMVEQGQLDSDSFKMSSQIHGGQYKFGSNDSPNLSPAARPILARTKTSSQLLSEAADSVLDDQSKISTFLDQLKAGAVPKAPTSEFRKRRLTYDEQTKIDEDALIGDGSSAKGKQKPPVRAARTSIFASSEIGVVQEKKPPFNSEILGTYSCHGIEPDMNSDSGIHEKINQDRGCVVYPYNAQPNEALFAVMDGHGEHGDKVSEFTMRQIVVSLEKDPLLPSDPGQALKNAFITTNSALLVTQIHYMTSGTTCVVVYVKGKTLYVANAGDSRAVMAYSEGDELKARDMSRDHKPDDPEEMERIIKWGGYVCPAPEEGLSARVYLDPEFTMIGLAMARSIGDHAVKAVGVIPEPEITEFTLQGNDQFMIMASDGVWEFISSQEAVDIVEMNLHKGCHEACQELIEIAASRWQEEEGDYRDDITAIVVKFPLPFQQEKEESV